ncbi:complement receptor type 1-like [Carettochelys insculpta]|uniref:complement receptor type 1-like n=1 Tax=Carettochelys insculpta TaxID=44489 RepID=UPI003EB6AA2C
MLLRRSGGAPLLVALLLLPLPRGALGGQCTAPEIENGKAEFTSLQVGATASFSCDEGYRLIGPTSVQCVRVENGVDWNENFPHCQGGCNVPPRLRFAELKDEYKNQSYFPVGKTVKYTCLPGYRGNPQIQHTITCLETQTWSEALEFCERKSCGHPGELENGGIIETDFLFGSTVHFTCDEGYRLIGRHYRQCEISDTRVAWSGDVPICERIPCLPPPDIFNGRITGLLVSDFSYGSSATYTCDRGYHLIGEASIHCTTKDGLNGEWNASPPQCEEDGCRAPQILNGRVSGHRLIYSHKDSITFECDPGYSMKGHRLSQCQNDHTWHPPVPACEPVKQCPSPPAIAHGRPSIQGVDVFRSGISVNYNCDPGYSVHGEVTLLCTTSGEWSSTPPQCKLQQCPSPPAITHGRPITLGVDVFISGMSVNFSCDPGYSLHGEAMLLCTASGEWSNAPPQCKDTIIIIAAILGSIGGVLLLFLVIIWRHTRKKKAGYSCTNENEEYQIAMNRVNENTWSVLESDSLYSSSVRSESTRSSRCSGHQCHSRRSLEGEWQRHHQGAPQWPFWTPWAIHKEQGRVAGLLFRVPGTPQVLSLALTASLGALPKEQGESSALAPMAVPAPSSASTLAPGQLEATQAWVPPVQAPGTVVQWIPALIELVPSQVQGGPDLIAPHQGPLGGPPPRALSMAPQIVAPGTQVAVPESSLTDLEGMLTSSSSSPDEALAGSSASPVLEDGGAYQQLLRRVTQSLGVQAEEVRDEVDPVTNILSTSGPSKVALAIIKTIANTAKTAWQIPASALPTARKNECRYFVPAWGNEHLFTHPSPDSLVVDVVNNRERQGLQGSSPKNKDAKRLDLYGRKVYSTGGLQLRIANQQAMVSRYAYNTASAMDRFTELLPPDAKTYFTTLVAEQRLISRAALQAALDAADAATRVMASGIAMRRGAWLQVLGLSQEVQQSIQDLPFEGPCLFSEKTDKRLHGMKDSRSTLRSLGLYAPATQTRQFNPRPQFRQEVAVFVPPQCRKPAPQHFEADDIIYEAMGSGETAPPLRRWSYVIASLFLRQQPTAGRGQRGGRGRRRAGSPPGSLGACSAALSPASPSQPGGQGTFSAWRAALAEGAGGRTRSHTTPPAPTAAPSPEEPAAARALPPIGGGHAPPCSTGAVGGEERARFGDMELLRLLGAPPLVPLLVLALLARAVLGDCGLPPRFPFAELSEAETDFSPVGTKLKYSCRSGYSPNSGRSPYVTCLADSRWSSDPDFCIGRPCKVLELANGRVGYTDIRFGATANFSCDEGYRLHGSASAKCVLVGKEVDWDASVPFCEAIPCDQPPDIAHGSHNRLGEEEFVVSSGVTYSCDQGFSLIGEASIHCTTIDEVNGVWSGPAPECKVVKCQEPEVANGKMRSGFGSHYSYGHAVTFECDSGYALSGSSSVKCEANNSWVPSLPTCSRRSCGHPGKLQNGSVTETDYLFGSMVYFTCDEGYQLIGPRYRRCEISGTHVAWSGDMPFCEQTGCPAPQIPNGRVSGHRRIYSHEHSITFECDPGYTMKGDKMSRCQTDNMWHPAVPVCEQVKQCPSPPAISHGRPSTQSVDIFTSGMSVNYDCDPGHSLHGEATLLCTASGEWSNDLPQCKRSFNVIGASLGITAVVMLTVFGICMIIRWRRRQSSSYKHESKKYEKALNQVNEISRSERQEAAAAKRGLGAMQLRRAGGAPPLVALLALALLSRGALGKPCKALELANGRVDYTDIQLGATVNFSCNEGYRLHGSASAKCVLVGKEVDWDASVPFCEAIPCDQPPDIAHGSHNRLGEEEFVVSSGVTYSCDQGFSLIGEASIHCTTIDEVNGVWSGPAPECKVVKCQEPEVSNGKMRSGFGSHYSYGHAVTFECDSGYALSGSSSVKCEANNSWVPSLPTCSTFPFCPHPVIKNGRVMPEAKLHYHVGESVYFECYRGNTLYGETNASCSAELAWEPGIPECTLALYVKIIIIAIAIIALVLVAIWIYKKYITQKGKRVSKSCTAEYSSCKA